MTLTPQSLSNPKPYLGSLSGDGCNKRNHGKILGILKLPSTTRELLLLVNINRDKSCETR
jgi:hypothetical protein